MVLDNGLDKFSSQENSQFERIPLSVKPTQERARKLENSANTSKETIRPESMHWKLTQPWQTLSPNPVNDNLGQLPFMPPKTQAFKELFEVEDFSPSDFKKS